MIPPPIFDSYMIPNISGGICFFSGLLKSLGGKFNRNIFHNRFDSHNFRNADSNDYDIPP